MNAKDSSFNCKHIELLDKIYQKQISKNTQLGLEKLSSCQKWGEMSTSEQQADAGAR
jgi:hypothetical protein